MTESPLTSLPAPPKRVKGTPRPKETYRWYRRNLKKTLRPNRRLAKRIMKQAESS